ncbi:MFS transporter [Planosporangium thailandense]|uniref:MFS transporter n=1 Tax=Planosporangium thailandense TaxID=765197 RepID=A0ABX0Y4J7_9ACTN|nr:MFS transporter [Planosporangium thailandense]
MGYLSLLRSPFVLRLLAGTLIGRLPTGMGLLAVPLVLRHARASYGLVGLASGALAISAAVGGPLLGRLVDRIGQPRVLLPTAVLAGGGFLLIGAAPHSPPVVLTGAVLAGAATPPLEPCLRVLWPHIVAPDLVEKAYAMDSGAQELIFIGAPLIVTGMVALASPASALWLAALLGLLGVLVVATAPPSRNYRAPERSADWLGPLRSRGLVVLFAGLIGTGGAIGSLNVLVVRYAEQHRVPAGAGGLLALNAAGALCGAVGYGLIRWTMSMRARALLLAAGLMTSYAMVGLRPAPSAMAVLMVVTGLFLAPMLTVSFVLVDRLAPPGTITEAFAWLVTVFTTGSAVGAAVVGVLLDRAAPVWASSCGGIATAATVVVLLVGRRTLVGGEAAAVEPAG